VPAGPETVSHKVNRISNSVQRAIDCIGDIPVFVIYEPDDTTGLQPINVFCPWIGLLGYSFGLVRHRLLPPRSDHQDLMKYNTPPQESNATHQRHRLKRQDMKGDIGPVISAGPQLCRAA